MLSKETKNLLNQANYAEFDNAIKNHGYFKNLHEGLAVLAEESVELSEEAETYLSNYEYILKLLFSYVRGLESEYVFLKNVEFLEDCAIRIQEEVTQVIAVCEKMKNFPIMESDKI